jgi:photosystem II stability/assembly factor-like uncharacterized protein
MNKKAFNTALFVFAAFVNVFSILSQEPSWKLLPGSPSLNSRYDDLSFINPQTGWIGNASGNIYKTTNGGINWTFLVRLNNSSSYVRSICFLDTLLGFAGTLNGSQHFFKTSDGGISWDSVSLFPGSIEGLCGLSFFGNTVMGSGVYSGSPKVVLSTDRGSSWAVLNLSSYVTTLVDCYLVSENEAFVVGGIGAPFTERKSVILHTSNAGGSWESRFTSSRIGNWGWKISFPDPNVGYVSLENSSISAVSYFAKTTDGGISWSEKPYGTGANFREQGIGFVNANTGWMGGYDKFYATTNGGDNWFLLNIGPEFSSINRIRFYGDTLGYAAGLRIYKFTSDKSIGIWSNQSKIPIEGSLSQNYPNPFNPVTVIKYEIFEKSVSTIKIFNAAGEEVYSFANGFRAPGVREFIWYGTDHNGNLMPSGVYFYRLETENFVETKKMILVR